MKTDLQYFGLYMVQVIIHLSLCFFEFQTNKTEDVDNQTEGDGQEEQLNEPDEPTDAEVQAQLPEPGNRESPSRKSENGEAGEGGPGVGEAKLENCEKGGIKDGETQVEESGEAESPINNDRDRQSQLNLGEGASPEGEDKEGNPKEEQEIMEEAERQSQKEELLERESQRGNSAEKEKGDIEDISLEKDEEEEDATNEAQSPEEQNTINEDTKDTDKDSKGKGNESPEGEGDILQDVGHQDEGGFLEETSPQNTQLAGFRALYPAPEGLSLLKPHQSDNLSAITEENSNIGDESTSKSLTEEEKEIEEPGDTDGKGCTALTDTVTFSPLDVRVCCTVGCPKQCFLTSSECSVTSYLGPPQ